VPRPTGKADARGQGGGATASSVMGFAWKRCSISDRRLRLWMKPQDPNRGEAILRPIAQLTSAVARSKTMGRKWEISHLVFRSIPTPSVCTTGVSHDKRRLACMTSYPSSRLAVLPGDRLAQGSSALPKCLPISGRERKTAEWLSSHDIYAGAPGRWYSISSRVAETCFRQSAEESKAPCRRSTSRSAGFSRETIRRERGAAA
jgi:hypothetical protein